MNEAIKREKQIKKWRREKKEKLITSFNPEWKFLNLQAGGEILETKEKQIIQGT